MEQINYEKLLPARPEEDVAAFACQNGAFPANYLVYRSGYEYEPLEDRMRDAVQVSCSACGKSFFAEKVRAGGCRLNQPPAPFGWFHPLTTEAVISGSETVCPLCGQKAETVHIGKMRLYAGEIVDDAWVSVLSRLPVEGHADRLVLTEWCVRRCVNKQAAVWFEVWPYTAWVVEETKVVRLMGYRKCLSSLSLLGRWEQRKTFVDCYGEAGLVMPWKPSLLAGTTAENCKLDLYQKAGGTYLAAYLALWRRHPAVENLLVQGCGKLVKTWISRESAYPYSGRGVPKLEAVNWKEKSPARMLGLNKAEFRQLRKGRWSTEDLEKYRMVRDAGIPVRLPEDMDLLRSRPAYDLNRILEEAPRADFWRILRYLKRQKSDWSTLWDYWSMAKEDGRNLEDGLVRWPRSLKASHDRQIQERQAAAARRKAARRAEQIAARAPLFLQRAEDLERFSFAQDGLLIRPCASEEELIREGNLLHHCVASYAKDHAAGKTAILFIRKADEPDKPFFTLEFDEKNMAVRQNRGLRNCGRTPEVEAFEKAWLAWVKSKKKRRTAA